jgi:hypothetical protein
MTPVKKAMIINAPRRGPVVALIASFNHWRKTPTPPRRP